MSFESKDLYILHAILSYDFSFCKKNIYYFVFIFFVSKE
ncbi:hypothetical protein HMPREF0860_1896 [Treponema socranskii subsp. socranskii VPI DR56BR1116 = ATCC 35536]|uniref:Uncharacterized protein n=1 Tax=Treponema socranskii subsp. socranskii VPI DR56BR1116 = ATCC 35536 TaxID=1125725 RepID=U2L3G3_TRESO|nr:hypothetical protein HMPREF1325_0911 [Treponema socranskii subsp. socranskii VPI DR56BR1116 = ATCC 35536]ERJ98895.1 hypothetical protein HMPREF0860_1896 [Treponema socranskii subsp. socranskii VPI DR56BR1116 = ATCC 35536]